MDVFLAKRRYYASFNVVVLKFVQQRDSLPRGNMRNIPKGRPVFNQVLIVGIKQYPYIRYKIYYKVPHKICGF